MSRRSPTDPEALSGLPLFTGLPLRQLERLASFLHERTFPAGTNLLAEGQTAEAVYVLLAGSAKVYTTRHDGAEVILALLGPGEVLGEMGLSDSLGRSADVAALEQTTLLWMDRSAFRSSLAESPALARNLAEVLSRRLRLTNASLITLATLDVSGRLAAQLLALAGEYGEGTPEGTRIPMRLNQTDLAALVGASRVRVNQAMGPFRKRGLISVGQDGRVTVLDKDALARRAR